AREGARVGVEARQRPRERIAVAARPRAHGEGERRAVVRGAVVLHETLVADGGGGRQIGAAVGGAPRRGGAARAAGATEEEGAQTQDLHPLMIAPHGATETFVRTKGGRKRSAVMEVFGAARRCSWSELTSSGRRGPRSRGGGCRLCAGHRC